MQEKNSERERERGEVGNGGKRIYIYTVMVEIEQKKTELGPLKEMTQERMNKSAETLRCAGTFSASPPSASLLQLNYLFVTCFLSFVLL